MMAILDPNFRIEFPTKGVENFDPLVVDVLKKCLVRDPSQRASIEELLSHPYLQKDVQPGVGRCQF
jgi:serine/threonine-protein kinase TTK/MPS1